MKRKYILVLDVETANSLEDALVYDIGYIVADLYGNIVVQKSFSIKEIFSLRPELMASSYYADKLPLYYKEIEEGQRKVVSLYEARQDILLAMRLYKVKEVYAYNASFDRRALNTTYRYLTKSKFRWFFPYGTQFYCIWSMACDTIFQQKTFRKIALRESWLSASGKYFATNAEIAYRYITGQHNFEEAHRGIDDVLIEYQVMLHSIRQKKKMSRKINRQCWRKVKV